MFGAAAGNVNYVVVMGRDGKEARFAWEIVGYVHNEELLVILLLGGSLELNGVLVPYALPWRTVCLGKGLVAP